MSCDWRSMSRCGEAIRFWLAEEMLDARPQSRSFETDSTAGQVAGNTASSLRRRMNRRSPQRSGVCVCMCVCDGVPGRRRRARRNEPPRYNAANERRTRPDRVPRWTPGWFWRSAWHGVSPGVGAMLTLSSRQGVCGGREMGRLHTHTLTEIVRILT